MKKFLSLSLLTCLIISGCNSAPQSESELPEDTSTTTQEPTTVEPTTESQEDTNQTPKPKKQAETNSISYYNEAYDFSLGFPSTWLNYTVTPEITTNSKQTYYFGFKEQFDIFAVSVFTEDQWNLIYSEGGPKPTELGRKNGYVIGYEVGQDAVSSEIYERFVEIPQILSTFK